MESMNELGRQAVAAVKAVARLKWEPEYYVNKTAKYVSIKIITDNLTPKQMARVEERLRKNPRFLKVHNGTAHRSACRMDGDKFYSVEWTEPKVMVRFKQG